MTEPAPSFCPPRFEPIYQYRLCGERPLSKLLAAPLPGEKRYRGGLAAERSSRAPGGHLILVLNGGSSSIKLALFEAGQSLQTLLRGSIRGIGRAQSVFRVEGTSAADNFERPLVLVDHAAAIGSLLAWLEERLAPGALIAVGHRVVHGGPKFTEPQRITPELVQELRRLSPLDPEHLPQEIELIEALQRHFPDLPEIACFDTAFHHDLPRVARLLAIPRRYEAQGVRRYGFHGLSYAVLMAELVLRVQ